MPYVKPYDPSKAIQTGAGGAPGVAGSAPAGPAGPAPTPQGQSSGAFVDFGRYLDANKDATSGIANQITGGLESEAQKAMGVTPTQPGHWQTDDIIAKKADYHTDAAGRPVGSMNDLHTPSTYWAKDGPVDPSAANAARSKALGDINAATSQGGLQALTQKRAAGPYTQGQSAFDSQLIKGSGADKSIEALRGKYAGLLQPIDPSAPDKIGSTTSELKTKRNNGLDW